jgi:hypothetical protein
MRESGPGDYLAVSASFPLMEKKMLPELQLVFEVFYPKFVWKAAKNVFESHEKDQFGQPAYKIFVCSAQNARSLESATGKAAWLDEAGQEDFGRDAWDATLRRLSLSRGRILITTTPYHFGWHYFEVYKKSPQGGGDNDIETICFDSLENPAFSVEQYLEYQRTLPWWKFAMYCQGRYERPAGAVYDTFNPETQVIPAIPLNMRASWPVYTFHDFGPNNTAALVATQDPGTGWVYIIHEYLRGGLSPLQHVENFKEMTKGLRVMQRVAGSGGKDEDEKRYSYTAAGWPVIPSRIRSVDAGIIHVYSFIATNQLFVFDTCEMFLNEIMSYSYKLDENNQPTQEIINKSAFHLMDSLRGGLSIIDRERAQNNHAKMLKTYARRSILIRRGRNGH